MINWRPSFGPGDEGKFIVLKRYSNVPAVAYHSAVGNTYYALNNPLAPYAEKVILTIELLGLLGAVEHEGAQRGGGVTPSSLKALRYSSNKGTTEVYDLMGNQYGSPSLGGGGRILFFGFVYNPDHGGASSQVVNRVATVGLTYAHPPAPRGGTEQWGDFVFLRDLDTLGSGFPSVENQPLDFQIFSSPDYGLYKDIVIEAGSPANL